MAKVRNLQITDENENLMTLEIVNAEKIFIEIKDFEMEHDYYSRCININKKDAIELCKELEKFINC
jgi:hypothetical protein